MHKNLKFFVMGAALVAGGLMAIAVGDMTVFKAGDPIKSAEMNANFAKLKEAIEQPVRTQQLEDGAITLPKLSIGGDGADGKVVKLQNGSLTWADDLLGTGGGAAYTAGSGLSLSGTTFSLSDGGVTRSKLAASGGSDGQVLKLQGGNLTWANDNAGGGGGTTYSADGSSLQLSGNTFSVRDGGIGTAKLADGSVSAIKLAAKLGGDGQVLKLRGDRLIWADDNTGGSGYSADGSSLQLSGVTFSVRDGGIGSAKLGGGSVTSEKLRVPLRLISAGDGAPPLTISTPDVGLRVETRADVSISSQSADGDAVRAVSTGGHGVYATSISKPGVFGYSAGKDGVYGQSTVAAGLYGVSRDGSGVVGIGQNGYAAEFSGGRFGRGICYFAGGSGWSCTSDRNAKENFTEVDVRKVLQAVVNMPVTRWNMKGDASKTPHIGPVAQDFYAAFKVGNDNKTISTSDAQGVALAAIQGLYQEVQLLRVQDRDLRQKLGEMEARLRRFENPPMQRSRP